MKRILSRMRKAIEDYSMITEGDRIVVGVSGGKDSLTMLLALNRLKKFFSVNFDIIAVVIDLGFDGFDITPIQSLCEKEDIALHVEHTLIGRIVFDERKEKSPCSLCSNMKRGAIHNVAKALNCNKIAFGHHMDDAVETFLMSLFYEGRINMFSPVTYLDRKDVTLIRPFIYVEEKQIKSFIKKYQIEPMKKICKMDGFTKRQYIKELIIKLSKENSFLKSNVFGAIKRAEICGWKDV